MMPLRIKYLEINFINKYTIATENYKHCCEVWEKLTMIKSAVHHLRPIVQPPVFVHKVLLEHGHSSLSLLIPRHNGRVEQTWQRLNGPQE